jgi:hypothetical protein
MDGILYGSVLPFIPALCLAPSAACSYFSTSVICLWSYATLGVSGCVDVSFNCSMIASSSSMRSSSFFVVCSYDYIYVSNWVICCWGAADLVVLWVWVSWFALSSCLVTLSTRSSIIFSKCEILDCYSLLIAS